MSNLKSLETNYFDDQESVDPVRMLRDIADSAHREELLRTLIEYRERIEEQPMDKKRLKLKYKLLRMLDLARKNEDLLRVEKEICAMSRHMIHPALMVQRNVTRIVLAYSIFAVLGFLALTFTESIMLPSFNIPYSVLFMGLIGCLLSMYMKLPVIRRDGPKEDDIAIVFIIAPPIAVVMAGIFYGICQLIVSIGNFDLTEEYWFYWILAWVIGFINWVSLYNRIWAGPSLESVPKADDAAESVVVAPAETPSTEDQPLEDLPPESLLQEDLLQEDLVPEDLLQEERPSTDEILQDQPPEVGPKEELPLEFISPKELLEDDDPLEDLPPETLLEEDMGFKTLPRKDQPREKQPVDKVKTEAPSSEKAPVEALIAADLPMEEEPVAVLKPEVLPPEEEYIEEINPEDLILDEEPMEEGNPMDLLPQETAGEFLDVEALLDDEIYIEDLPPEAIRSEGVGGGERHLSQDSPQGEISPDQFASDTPPQDGITRQGSFEVLIERSAEEASINFDLDGPIESIDAKKTSAKG